MSQQRFSSNSAHLSSHSSHSPPRTCSLHWTSRQWTTVAATPKKPFSSGLSEFRAISSLSMRKLLGCVRLEAMRDTQFHLFQTDSLRKTDASHGVFVLEQTSSRRSGRRFCFWHSWTSRRPLATSSTPSRPQRKTKGYPSSCSRCSTNGGPRARLQSAWQRSPATHAFPSSEEPPGIFLAVSDHVLGGLDEHLLKETTSVPLHQAEKISSAW